jgi:pseudouridine-5'-phosphate glycosidase
MNDWFGSIEIAPEAARALAGNGPVVALESTLIAHGLPWPDNLETALESERVIRAAGAVPATIAALGGKIRVGLSEGELESLARPVPTGGPGPWKAGRRDLAIALAQRVDAATTVSATSWAAHRVGIGVMATGGLGGVHRDASQTFDISADLDALARADGLALVCSGVKTILDVPATLEVLETLGVVVVGLGTAEFPGFTCRTTGLPLEARVDSPGEAAVLIRSHRGLGLPGAIVLAQPVPEAEALDPLLFEKALAAALDEARARGVVGKPLTPFLLDQIRLATSGESLRANRALIVRNAATAGRIATELAPG